MVTDAAAAMIVVVGKGSGSGCVSESVIVKYVVAEVPVLPEASVA